MKKIKEFFGKLRNMRKKHLFIACAALIVLFAGLFVFMLFRYRDISIKLDHMKSQKEEVETVYAKDKEQMQEQITLLSNQVAEQIAKEEKEAEKFYPNGLPVSGKVTIEYEPDKKAEEEEANQNPPEETSEPEEEEKYPKMVIFGAANDAKVMAAGSGKVQSVNPDGEFGYVVRIDHGNGYLTIYRYNDTPKIKEGDDVTKGQLLFEVGFASSKVGYQIMYDNEYVNPMEVMEING